MKNKVTRSESPTDDYSSGDITVTKLEDTEESNKYGKYFYGESGYNMALAYKNNLEKALSIAATNKRNNVKTYKKELSGLRLPLAVKSKIVNGTYTKSSDEEYQEVTKAIREYERRKIRTNRKVQKKGGMAQGVSRVFQKRAKGTNLQYWIDKNPNVIPYLHPAVQEFVLAAPDLRRLPTVLANHIKNATLTTYVINDFIRDNYDKDINDYTFQALKNSFFRNTPFNSFNELKKLMNTDAVKKAYSLQAVIKNQEALSQYLYRSLGKNPLRLIDKLVDKLKTLSESTDVDKEKQELYTKVYKLYCDVYERFDYYYKIESNNKGGTKKVLTPINFSNADADIALGLLNYYEGNIDSLAYVAGNAKKAVISEMETGLPFTYKSKLDQFEHKESTVNIDTTIKGGKGDDSDMDLAEVIADPNAVNFDENLSDVSNLSALLNNTAEYYEAQDYTEGEAKDLIIEHVKNEIAKLVQKRVSEDKIIKIGKVLRKKVKSLTKDEAVFYLSILDLWSVGQIPKGTNGINNIIDLFKITKDDIKNVPQTVESERTEENKIADMRHKKKVYRTMYEITKYMTDVHYNNLPDEYKQYFIKIDGRYKAVTSEVYKLNNYAVDNINNDLLELKKRLVRGDFLSKSAAKASERLIAKNKKLEEKNKKLKEELNEPRRKIKTVHKIQLNNDVSLESTVKIPDVLSKLINVTFYNTSERTMQFYAVKDETDFRVSAKDFFEQNAETLNALTYEDACQIMDYLTMLLRQVKSIRRIKHSNCTFVRTSLNK